MIRRRAAAIVFAQSLFLLCPLEAQIKLHLIGTGGPELTPARASSGSFPRRSPVHGRLFACSEESNRTRAAGYSGPLVMGRDGMRYS